MATKTKMNPIVVLVVCAAILGGVAMFGGRLYNYEYNSPIFSPHDKKTNDNNHVVEYKSWSDVPLHRPISIFYAPGGRDGGVTEYEDFQEWFAVNTVKSGTYVKIQAVSGVTVRFFHVRLTVDGKNVCEKKASLGSIKCDTTV